MPLLVAVLCLWWLGGGTATAETGSAEPQEAGDTAGLTTEREAGAEQPETESDAEAEGDADEAEGEGAPADSPPVMLRTIVPVPAPAPAPEAGIPPVPVQPAQPKEPVAPPGSPPVENSPAESSPSAPPSPAGDDAPAPRQVERASAPTPPTTSTSTSHAAATAPSAPEFGDAAVLSVGGKTERDDHTSVVAVPCDGERPAPRGVESSPQAGVRSGSVAPTAAAIDRGTARYPVVVGRSAPMGGAPQPGAVPATDFTEAALDGVVGEDIQIPESDRWSGALAATVSLPGGSAPPDSPLARIADYLMYGGTAASGMPPSLLAVVTLARTRLGAPAAGGESVVDHDAGAPRPAHAYPLRRPG